MGLVEDNAGVDVDDGDVDAEGVGGVVGVLDFWFGGGRGRWRLVSVGLFLEDDGPVVGLGAGVVGRRRGGLGLLRSVLGMGGRGRGDKGAGDYKDARGAECVYGAEGGTGLELRKSSHHVKLYSEVVDASLDETASRRLCVAAAKL